MTFKNDETSFSPLATICSACQEVSRGCRSFFIAIFVLSAPKNMGIGISKFSVKIKFHLQGENGKISRILRVISSFNAPNNVATFFCIIRIKIKCFYLLTEIRRLQIFTFWVYKKISSCYFWFNNYITLFSAIFRCQCYFI